MSPNTKKLYKNKEQLHFIVLLDILALDLFNQMQYLRVNGILRKFVVNQQKNNQ